VIAYATACGGEREEWEQRWRACTQELAAVRPEIPAAVSALADQAAGSGHLPPANRLRPEDLVSARERRHGRRSAATLGAVALTATALLVGIGAAADAPPRADPAAARAAFPDSVAMEPLGMACDPNGIIARLPGRVHAPQGQAARVRASFEAGFDPSRDGWSPWWGKDNVVEDLTTSHAYDGQRSLRVRVTSGQTAIGTIHLAGLTPGGTVTIRIWYGGQGEGYICPFAQSQKYAIEWIPQEDLQLTPSDWPGWRTYRWTIPGFAPLGTGIELRDTGASDFVILLDAVTW
jgi:hypothetical protein